MRKRLIVHLLAAVALLWLGACNKTADSGSTAAPGSTSSSASVSPATAASGAASSDPVNSSSNAANPANAPSSANAPNGASQNASAPAAAAPMVVRSGTTLVVTVDQDVSTKTNSSGDRFVASLAEPVTVDGSVAPARDSKITGTVTQAESAGHIKGGAVLALTLDSITVRGEKYSLETSPYAEQGKGRGKRTAVGAGGGAAFGAIVGALAGGGKGAAIGALAGGGAGTAGTALTGNRDLTIPAETRLHFRLRQSLTIPQ